MVEERDADGWSEVADHEFSALWSLPNPNMGRGFMIQYWIWQLYLFGKAFLYFAPSTDGTLREMWPLPSSRVKAIGSDKNFVDHYEYRVKRGEKLVTYELPPELVCYSRFVNPFDPREGMPPLVAAFRAIDADTEMATSNLKFFSEGNAQPSGICRISASTGDADFLRLREDIQTNFGRGQHKTLFVRGDDVDYKILQWSPKEMMFTDVRAVSEREIHRACGVPDGYWSEKANRANGEHADQVLVNSIIWPIAANFAEDLNTQIVGPHYDGSKVRTSFRDIRQRNVDLEIRELEAKKAFYTIAELRTLYPPPEVAVSAFINGDEEDPRNDLFAVELGMGKAAEPETEPVQPQPPQLAAAQAAQAELLPELDEDEDERESKPDLALWQHKALKRLKTKGSASCPFDSDEISAAEHDRISAALCECKTADDVRRVFIGGAEDDTPAPTIADLLAEVRAARLALERAAQ